MVVSPLELAFECHTFQHPTEGATSGTCYAVCACEDAGGVRRTTGWLEGSKGLRTTEHALCSDVLCAQHDAVRSWVRDSHARMTLEQRNERGRMDSSRT